MIDKNDTDNIDVRFSKSLFLVLSNGNPRLSWKIDSLLSKNG